MLIHLFIIWTNLQSMMAPIRLQTLIDRVNIRIYNKKLIKKEAVTLTPAISAHLSDKTA